jgi:hypothetical protein
MTVTTCPACNYTRQPTDNVPDWECPKCQKAYTKTARTIHKPISHNDAPLAFDRLSLQIEKDSAPPVMQGKGPKIEISQPFLLASVSIWGAVIFAPLVCIISGPTYTNAPNQGAMVLRFLWFVAFLVFSILAVKRATNVCEPQDKKRIEILGAVLWLPGMILNLFILNAFWVT